MMKTKITLLIALAMVACSSQQNNNGSSEEVFNRKTAAPKVQNLRLPELPAIRKGEMVVSHTGMTLSYNTEHNNPNWVAWELTREETNGRIPRSNDFQPDPLLEKRYQVDSYDYKGSGYSRGHMCPAADMKWDNDAMRSCFYMSNMCPQDMTFNAESWERLENACRRWARQEGSVYIVCGPIYNSNRKISTIGRNHTISVPTGFFKCVLSLQKGQEKAIGFIYSHNDINQPMGQAATSVDEVERITGYDFFANIDKKTEKRVEATFNLTAWK